MVRQSPKAEEKAPLGGRRVLSVASEIFPLIKTGGLADVVGALPAAMAEIGVKMRSLVPGYPSVIEGLGRTRKVAEIAGLFGGDAQLLEATEPGSGLKLLVLDAPWLYRRPGGPYLGPDGRDWADNAQRFAALSWAAREIGMGAIAHWRPDVVHAHDWQAGLAPAYLRFAGEARPATVMTIHNIAFQGQAAPALLGELRLPLASYAIDGVEYFGTISALKGGLYYADMITTVSPSYAAEIQSPALGMGLHGLLAARADRLVGIVNGIDPAIWDPVTDGHLAKTYSVTSLGRRRQNKLAVQSRLGLATDADALLLCVVSRLTWQKGMDLLAATIPALVAAGCQLAVIGTGEPAIEAAFRNAALAHPGRVACLIDYDEAASHQLQGGADAILIPSRFEPCGLTQLYGLRYGCVPIVARVGGLADTLVDANDAALADGVATGFQFAPVDQAGIVQAVRRALRVFKEPKAWQAMQRRGMVRDLSWSRPARRYAQVYDEAIARKEAA